MIILVGRGSVSLFDGLFPLQRPTHWVRLCTTYVTLVWVLVLEDRAVRFCGVMLLGGACVPLERLFEWLWLCWRLLPLWVWSVLL